MTTQEPAIVRPKVGDFITIRGDDGIHYVPPYEIIEVYKSTYQGIKQDFFKLQDRNGKVFSTVLVDQYPFERATNFRKKRKPKRRSR